MITQPILSPHEAIWVRRTIENYEMDKLPHKEFCEIYKIWKRTKDAELLNKLIKSHYKILIKPAFKVFNINPSLQFFEDLISIGKIELISGLKKYEVERDLNFGTYVRPRIYWAMFWCFNKYKYGQIHYPFQELKNYEKIPQTISLDFEVNNTTLENFIITEDKGFQAFLDDDSYKDLVKTLKPEEKELIDWKYKEGGKIKDYAKKNGFHSKSMSRKHKKILKKLFRLKQNQNNQEIVDSIFGREL